MFDRNMFSTAVVFRVANERLNISRKPRKMSLLSFGVFIVFSRKLFLYDRGKL